MEDVPLEERMFVYKHMRFLYSLEQKTFVLVRYTLLPLLSLLIFVLILLSFFLFLFFESYRPIDQLKVILQTQGGFRGLSTAVCCVCLFFYPLPSSSLFVLLFILFFC